MFKTKKCWRLASGCLQVVAAPVMEPPVHIQGPELLTASVLAAAPPMDQKQLLGLSSVSSACFVFFPAMQIETACVYLSSFHCLCCDTQGSDCTHWFTLCIQTWLVKSLGCCWRSTTLSCCICWSRPSPCTLRYINVHVFLWAGLHSRLYIKMDDKPQLPSPVQQWNQNSSKIGGAGLFYWQHLHIGGGRMSESYL